MQIAAREIVLWTTPSEPPKALQASECSELLDPMRASCLILAQHQPGKFRDRWVDFRPTQNCTNKRRALKKSFLSFSSRGDEKKTKGDETEKKGEKEKKGGEKR